MVAAWTAKFGFYFSIVVPLFGVLSESASIGDCKILQPKGDGDGGGDIDFQLPLDAGRKAIILKCGFFRSGWRSFKTFSA